MKNKLASRASKLSLPSQESNFFSTAYAVSPEDLALKPLGKLYIALEIANPGEDNKEVGNALLESLKEEYYNDPSREVLESFEAALQKANETLADLTEAGKTNWLGKLHMIIAVLAGDTLHLAQSGGAEAYLARGEQIVKISEGLTETDEEPQPLKTFENIASGNIEEDDRVIISTPELFYHASLEEIRRGLKDKNPEEAAKEISEKLRGEEGIGNLAALFVEIATEEKFAEEPLSSALPEKEKEDDIINDIKEDAKNLGDKTKEKFKIAQKSFKDKLKKNAGKQTPTISSDITESIRPQKTEMSQPMTQTTESTPKTEEGVKKITAIFRQLGQKVRGVINKITQSSLNRNQLLLGAIMILILVFLISGGILIWNNQGNSTEQEYQNKLTSAQDKYKAAEDALIYDNEGKARELLQEATGLVAEILASKYFNEEAKTLEGKITTTLDKTDHVTRITDAKVTADFSSLPSSEKLQTIIALDKFLYTFNPDSASVFNVSLETPKPKTAAGASISVGKLKCSTVMSDSEVLVFYNETAGIYELDSNSNQLTKKEIEAGASWSQAVDISTYFSYLYLLDPTQNQIYKHSRTISGYGRGSEYITESGIDLSKAVSLAIDGNVYVLTSDGKIIKFLQGAKTEFEISNLPGTLNSPTEIFIDPDTTYLYISDPSNNRIVALDEKGGFIAQYVSDDLNGATGFYADETAKKGYFLSGTKIYQFSLKHLK